MNDEPDSPRPLRSYQPVDSPIPGSQSPVIPSPEKHEGLGTIAVTIGFFLIAPIIALALVAFVFQSYQVEGPSMETTLQDQDRLIVLKAERTWARITKKSFVPKRGDIIVFNQTSGLNYAVSGRKQLIKRVIGLPGERVVVQNGKVTIYNSSSPEGFNPDKTFGVNTITSTTAGNIDIIIPPGEIFVSGDNRGNSLDSRSFGPVPVKDVVGTLALRIYPLTKAQKF